MKVTDIRTLRRLAVVALAGAVAVGVFGCLSPDQAVKEVDDEAKGILAQKQESLFGRQDPLDVVPAADRVATTSTENGMTRKDVERHLALQDILTTAARNSRDFQNAKETLYRALLALMRERENFRGKPFGTFTESASTRAGQSTMNYSTEFGVTNLIERGGNYALAVGLDVLRLVTSPKSDSAESLLNLTISLPFLRNAEQNAAEENLTQAEREVIYALRDFERYKQTYGVQIISSYLRMLGSHQRVSNEENNVKSLRYTRERNTTMAEEGRLPKVQADQALQQELSGEARLLQTRQNLDRNIDTLKILIGLPVDLHVTYEVKDLEGLENLVAAEFSVDEDQAMRAGLRGRYDFRNDVDAVADAERRLELAKNALQPDLTLSLSARPISKNLKPLRYNFQDGTYTATGTMDFALDRDIESISLRTSLLDLQRAFRTQEASGEQVKQEVRNALRQLVRTREAYHIAKESLTLAAQRTEMTRVMLEEGRVTTRDFLESQDSLITSQNGLVDALVEYRIAYLEFFRDTGALVVTPGGLDHETSQALLLGS